MRLLTIGAMQQGRLVLQAETKVYRDRVVADGGHITDIYKVDNHIKFLKANNLWDDLKTTAGGIFGIKIRSDDKEYVTKNYCLKSNDFTQTVDERQPFLTANNLEYDNKWDYLNASAAGISNSFGFTLWINPYVHGLQGLFTTGLSGMRVYFSTTNIDTRVRKTDGNYTTYQILSGSIPTSGSYNLLTINYDHINDQFIVYLNSDLSQTTTSIGGIHTPNGNINLGWDRMGSFTHYYYGLMNLYAVYDRIITESEHLAIFNKGNL